jgi:hypothetical protein
MGCIVFVNGPPRAGKDTAVKLIQEWSQGEFQRVGFADHLKEATHAAYGLFGPDGKPLPYDYFEHCKGEPRPEFFGITPRQAYINHSEKYMKEFHGQDVYGHLYVKRLKDLYNGVPPEYLGVPDSGFYPEMLPPMDYMPHHYHLLLRIHRDGCNFSNDSRSYLYNTRCHREIDITNNEDIFHLRSKIWAVMKHTPMGGSNARS